MPVSLTRARRYEGTKSWSSRAQVVPGNLEGAHLEQNVAAAALELSNEETSMPHDQLIRRIKRKMKKNEIDVGSKLALTEVAEFEGQVGVSLPESYRRFLTEVGNGASGPASEFDLLPLGTVPSGFHTSRANVFAGLVKPFKLRKAWLRAYQSLSTEEWRDLRIGALPVASNGPDTWVLVVSGGQRGKIWQLSRDGAAPNSPPRDFLEWYDYWLDGAPDDWAEEAVPPKHLERDLETNLPTRPSLADPLQQQKDVLHLSGHRVDHDPESAMALLSKVIDPSLQGEVRFLRARAAAVSGESNAESLVVEIANEWLAPATLGSVNQRVVRSEVLALLDSIGGPRVNEIADKVKRAPEPEIVLPSGDFF